MLIDQNVKVAKETADVLAAVVVIVKDIKAGKTILEIGTGALPALINAVGGIDQVPEELTDRRAILITTAIGVSDLLDVLLTPALLTPAAE